MKKATIESRTDFSKIGAVKLVIDGKSKEFKFWLSDAFAVELKEGSEIEYESEKRARKDKPGEEDVWLTKVNGIPAKAPKASGGGGFARPQVNDASIASQTILKEACDSVRAIKLVNPKLDMGEEISSLAMSIAETYISVYKAIKEAM